MKKLFYILVLITGFANAQIVNIPDANFKAKLIALGIDVNTDSEIQVSEALATTSVLNISGSSISDLTGFEAFTNVNVLQCPNNQLTALNLNNLPNLKSIDAGYNSNLSTLNLTNISLDTLKVNSGNLTNLDLSNLTSLKHLDCSYNHLTSLNLTGMTNLKSLNCSYDFLGAAISLAGLINLEELDCSNNNLFSLNVASLTNLKKLVCANDGLSIVDVSNLTNLEFLDWSNNQNSNFLFANVPNLKTLYCVGNTLTSLDVTSLPGLLSLQCNSNNLTSINVSGLINLQELVVANNQLTSIDVSGLTSLQTLNVFSNSLPTLTVSGLTNLQHLDASANYIMTSLNLTGLNNLNYLSCAYNQLASLNVNQFTQLQTLYCNNNLLNTLDISGMTNLESLYGATNSFTSLTLTGATSLQWLDFNFNQMTTVDFTGLSSLGIVLCDHNQLTSLDFSNNPLFDRLNCSYNNLTNINIKNGLAYLNTSVYFWDENPNLVFVCADEGEFASVQQILNQSTNVNNGNVVFNTYCSFTPGGNYNTITGTMTFDANNNGCDASDDIQSNIRVNINDGTTTGASFTNSSANYTFYTPAGSFAITPSIENPTWFNISPTSATIPFADNNNNTVTQNFCITSNGVHPDLEIVIAPITPARPGFDAVYEIVYRNKGNQTMSQLNGISFSFDNNVMSYVSSSDATSSVGAGTLTWDLDNLSPFESRAILVTMHVNSPTDPNFPVNIGDILTLSSTVNPIAADENPSDNTFQFNQTVVGSFDPNDITCIEGNLVSPSEIGNYLHYIINFENTGTADAENIVVRDVIDTTQFDVNSLQLLNSSAPVTARLTGNVAEFIFPNINLHSGGHGNILIKIKSKNTLVQGDSINKKASIYFDYNAPVDTNLENTIFQSLSNSDYETDATISVYPNPTNGNVNINCNNTIKSVQLFDVQGRLLQTNLVNENQTSIDISNKSKGVYFLKIISDKGIGVEKIVRE